MDFEDWFKSQRGGRPSSVSTAKLIQKARGLEEEAKATRELITKCNEWEAQHSTARSAWIAAGGRE